MKKLFIATIALAIFMLCSCSSKSIKAESVNPEPGIEVEVSEDEISDMATLAADVTENVVLNLDGKELAVANIGRVARISDDIYMSLNVYVPVDAKPVIEDISAKVDSAYAFVNDTRIPHVGAVDTPEALAAQFEALCLNFTDSVAPEVKECDVPVKAFSIIVDYRPVYAFNEYITYLGYNEFYTGGAHPMHDATYYTINTRTGEVYDFETLVEARYRDDVRKALVETIARAEEQSVEEYLKSVNDYLLPDEPVTVDNFPIYGVAVSDQGLLFSYPIYTIAPYCEGNPTYALPIESVKGALTIKVD